MDKKIFKNYFYNLVYQIFNMIIPLITVPYVSRVLGPDGIGLYAFTNSIVQYFVLFGTIGLSLYGNRAIAYSRDNRKELSRTYWEILSLRIILSLISFFVYLVLLSYSGSNKVIFLIQSINILASMIDISWFLMGLEEFKKTVTRNIIIKMIGIVCIFLFVKYKSDLWKYIFIYSFSGLIGQLVMWKYVPRFVFKPKITLSSILRHFMPAMKLFIPQVSIQVYLVLDKTMIGSIASITEVGYYDQSEKIIKIALVLVTAMGTVMLPRMSNIFAKGDSKKLYEYIIKSIVFATSLALPIMFGLAGISKGFVPWFLGDEFTKVILIMIVISPIILAISLSNAIGMQYLLPVGRNKHFTVSVTAGAAINIALNLFLIRILGSLGAAIATVVAEWSVTIIQLWYIRKEVKLRELVSLNYKYLLSSSVMLLVIIATGRYLRISVASTLLEICIGTLTYIIVLFILKENYITSTLLKFLRFAK